MILIGAFIGERTVALISVAAVPRYANYTSFLQALRLVTTTDGWIGWLLRAGRRASGVASPRRGITVPSDGMNIRNGESPTTARAALQALAARVSTLCWDVQGG